MYKLWVYDYGPHLRIANLQIGGMLKYKAIFKSSSVLSAFTQWQLLTAIVSSNSNTTAGLSHENKATNPGRQSYSGLENKRWF